jgi:hypothetical protein
MYSYNILSFPHLIMNNLYISLIYIVLKEIQYHIMFIYMYYILRF